MLSLPMSVFFTLLLSLTAEDMPITGANGATLKDIVGTTTLVTVVLKETGARDTNLQVIEVTPTYFSVLTEKGERVPYLYSDVKEVILQGELVRRPEITFSDVGALRGEEQRVLDRAYARAEELFASTQAEQNLKIDAAVVLAMNKNKQAMTYLEQLLNSNDPPTQYLIATKMYLLNQPIPEKWVQQGLESGNLRVRATSIQLAGLTRYTPAVPLLKKMLADRSADISAPAALALARLGERDIIPDLIRMLGDLNETKGKAAVRALILLDSEDVTEELVRRVDAAEGFERFRMILVLYHLNHPRGRALLVDVFRNQPTLKPEAALLLAREGNFEASQYLRERLTKREDPNDRNLIFRAKVAAALADTGDPVALAVFQELLRSESTPAKEKVIDLCIDLGKRKLLTVLQPVVENVDTKLATRACVAVVALTNREFRERLLALRDE